MKIKNCSPWLIILFVCFTIDFVRAESEAIYCNKSHLFLAGPDSSEHRKYAPSREVDILHLAIDVTPDFQQRSVEGKVTLRFRPIAKALQELRLDGIDLTVLSATSTEKILGYQATDKNVIITFEEPVPPDKEASVTVNYRATPEKGLYFRTPEMGYKAEDMHLWTQGEPIEARHWYPSFDAPNEKFTSEVICRVPAGMVVLSNGKWMSEEKAAGSDLVAIRWLQDKPHCNYLISLVAGYLKKIEDKYKDVPLAFYTPASQIDQADSSFKDTKDMMGFFEEEIGVPYPWAKYYQVCVNDFGWGGMENTSIATLNDRTLFTEATENIHSSQGLVAHELAHQWFGDLVTCKDWSHIWLNEGFATYYERLYDGYKNGRDSMLYGLYQSAKQITNFRNETNSIVRRNYNVPEDVFGYLAYPKGSWVLHMLRSQLGQDLYRRCIKAYLERHQFETAVTEDLNAVIEELSGRSFDQFFDQWVYHTGAPELGVNYSWDEKNKLAKISISQNQKLSEQVLLFNFPLTIRFKAKSGIVDRQIIVKEKAEDFYFPLAQAPEIVRIDPDFTALASISFTPVNSMLYAQLADQSDMVGRLMAVEQLSGRKDALNKLKETLNGDSFYGVRIAASRSLRAIQSDEALDALLASTKQSDARVRREVVAAINGFYQEKGYAAAQKVLQEEKNPEIQALAITALGAYPKTEARAKLLEYLDSDSYRNTVANAAVGAIRAQDDVSYIEPLRDCLQKKEEAFTTGGFIRGLDTLAWLARNEEKKDTVREFLVARLNHKKKSVQVAVINALGTLGDPKAIAVLETFTSAPKESRERTAAEKVVADLRAAKKPSAEMGTLRTEVLALQKENRELRKEFDDLKKKVEAALPKPSTTKTNKPAASRKSFPR
jgi:aminopeptidase N